MENKDSNSGKGKQVMMISQQSNLSDELIFEEILTRLPVKSVLRFKSVSKKWYSTISSSHFTNAHLEKSPFSHPCANLIIIKIGCSTYYLLSYDDEVEVDEISQNFQDYLVKPTYLPLDEEVYFQVELIGSCNGLVCIASREGYYFLLWNPATRKLNKYASPPLDVFFNRFEKFVITLFVTCGFGHVSSAEDYKFVGILKVIDQNDYSESLFALIFSLRENRWTTIDLDDYIPHFYTSSGVLVSEKIYWPCFGQVNKFVSFDLAIERFDVDVDVVELDRKWDETLGMTAVKSIKLPLLDDMNILDSQKIGFTKNDQLFVYDGTMLTIPAETSTTTSPLDFEQLLKFEAQQCVKITRFIPSFVSPFHPSQEDSEITDVTVDTEIL